MRPIESENGLDLPRIAQAKKFAQEAHDGQKRSSGEPYYTHVEAVANLLKDIHADEDTIIAALLHDTIEDTSVTEADIRSEFGPTVAKLVQGVTKVEAWEETMDKKERNMWAIRKMFRTMGKDIRVIFIKLADRLHNMQTLDAVSSEKRQRVALETQELYVPLADLMGLREWYRDLSDLCFKAIHPTAYELLANKALELKRRDIGQLNQWLTDLQKFLAHKGVLTTKQFIQQRHLKSIFEESQEFITQLDNIEMFVRLHIVIPDEAQCYETLGVIHSFATPESQYFNDYIASPKINGYQALHSACVTPSGNVIEIIIQTESMHKQSQFGIATMYKNNTQQGSMELPYWVETLISLEEDEDDVQSFFDIVRTEIFGEKMRVHYSIGTKKNTVDLPRASSVLDCLYYIDPNLALKASTVTLNGKNALLKEHLSDGDALEIENSIRKKTEFLRTAEDLQYLTTSYAQKQLLTQLSLLPKRELLQRGRNHLQRSMEMCIDPFFSISWVKELRERVADNYEVLQEIGAGTINPFWVLAEHLQPQECFLLHPSSITHVTPKFGRQWNVRYVLRTSIEKLKGGSVIGLLAGPDVIEVYESDILLKEKTFSKEYLPLRVNPDMNAHPLHFSLRFFLEEGANPLGTLSALQSMLDTPVILLQFEKNALTVGFLTDSIKTIEIVYHLLASLPFVTRILRISPP